ncbi:MAG: ATP synthase F1 subunit delta [bacterium]|nr:ATP synthase F1 subunit delta [bacterium]MXV90162.1 ATP synthase F1 subunit delta [Acidimicrobiia bacterium]MYC45011.1 ATP synthase F1 subunit delta [Acidimicrobiia bacterium]
MSAEVVSSYAEALVAVVQAEGDLAATEDELFAVAQALAGSDELREVLADRRIPAARRQQIVEDLLEGQAAEATVALVSMVVGAGRGGDLVRIIEAAVERSAGLRNKAVAEVRSAIALSDDQQRRLAEALQQATGKDVTVKVIVDPTVMGGLVTRIGDEVIDGSVRTRINQLREAF